MNRTVKNNQKHKKKPKTDKNKKRQTENKKINMFLC